MKPLVDGVNNAVHSSVYTMVEDKEWLQIRLREFHIAKARDLPRIEMAKFNASMQHSLLSQDSLQSPRGPHGQGRANVFEAQYPRVKEETVGRSRSYRGSSCSVQLIHA